MLTERARDELRRPRARSRAAAGSTSSPPASILARFRPVPEAARPAEARGDASRFVILGGTGTWYLPEATAGSRRARPSPRDPQARLHVLTQDDPEPIRAGLARRGCAGRKGAGAVPSRTKTCGPGCPARRPGIALLRATWSKSASCPTKIGEMLACGVPLIVSAGIGDVDTLFAEERVGVTVADPEPDALEGALDALAALRSADPGLADRCRDVATRRFAVSVALDAYERAYAEAAA